MSAFIRLSYSYFKSRPNLTLFLFCWGIGFLHVLCTGPDYFFDMLNYHFYNPYAVLSGRLDTDIAPSGVHSYFSPTADFFYFIAFKLLAKWPYLLAFVSAVWYATALFFVFKIIRWFLPNEKRNLFKTAIPTLLFAFAPAILTHGGYNTTDISSTAPLMGSLYLTLSSRTLPVGFRKNIRFLIAGILYGVCFAFKYTTAPLLAGYIVMFVFCFSSLKDFFKYGFIFTAGALGSFALLGGFWCYKMYAMFDSPLFPFYNNIFQSPYFDPIALVDKRFFTGRSLWEVMALPFTFLFNQPMNTIEFRFRGISWLMYFSVILCWGKILLGKQKTKFSSSFKSGVGLLCIFFLVGYVLWLLLFSIFRYAMPLEAVGAILITLLLATLPQRKNSLFLYGVLCGIFCFYGSILPNIKSFPQANTLFYGKGTREKKPELVRSIPPFFYKDSVVILQGWQLSYYIPFLSPKTRYIGGLQPNIYHYPDIISRLEIVSTFAVGPGFFHHNFAPQVHQAIKEAKHVYVLMQDNAPNIFFHSPLFHYGVQVRPDSCQWVSTPHIYHAILCEADKI